MSDFRDHIAIIDYGMGNLHSVAKALEHVSAGAKITVTSDPKVVENADRVVFPGVGAIRDCMHEINRLDIGRVVKQAIQEKPVLAICVGMQALMQASEENGGIHCLDILPGQVKYFGDTHKDAQGKKLKVPHMGWNNVTQQQDHPLWHSIQQGSRVFFFNINLVENVKKPPIISTCDYGLEFAASLQKGNLFAVQFHPEKSADAGLQLLKNFCQWQTEA
jgi:glutamine amidotransferase